MDVNKGGSASTTSRVSAVRPRQRPAEHAGQPCGASHATHPARPPSRETAGRRARGKGPKPQRPGSHSHRRLTNGHLQRLRMVEKRPPRLDATWIQNASVRIEFVRNTLLEPDRASHKASRMKLRVAAGRGPNTTSRLLRTSLGSRVATSSPAYR